MSTVLQNRQTRGAYGSFGLSILAGFIVSSYFPLAEIDRDLTLTIQKMSTVATALSYNQSGDNLLCTVGYENADGTGYFQTFLPMLLANIPNDPITGPAYVKATLPSLFNTFCTNNGVTPPDVFIWYADPMGTGDYNALINKPTIPAAQIQSDWNQASTGALDFIKNKPTIPSIPSRSFNNAPGASIVTGTGATGTQISATRDAYVVYAPTMITTASISGNASDVIVLEICSTNSATAGSWIEIDRITNAQALTLAITLQSVQTTAGSLTGIVPAGYYRKIRSITSGTVSNSMSSGQEVLL